MLGLMRWYRSYHLVKRLAVRQQFQFFFRQGGAATPSRMFHRDTLAIEWRLNNDTGSWCCKRESYCEHSCLLQNKWSCHSQDYTRSGNRQLNSVWELIRSTRKSMQGMWTSVIPCSALNDSHMLSIITGSKCRISSVLRSTDCEAGDSFCQGNWAGGAAVANKQQMDRTAVTTTSSMISYLKHTNMHTYTYGHGKVDWFISYLMCTVSNLSTQWSPNLWQLLSLLYMLLLRDDLLRPTYILTSSYTVMKYCCCFTLLPSK